MLPEPLEWPKSLPEKVLDTFLASLFALNLLLTLADAAAAWHAAPSLVTAFNPDENSRERSIDKLRSLLSLMVGLYVFLNCKAYAAGTPGYLIVLLLLLVADLLFQNHICRKGRKLN